MVHRTSRLIRSVKISFDRDVPVFGKRDFALFKKMAVRKLKRF
jgi:hypothetical protein